MADDSGSATKAVGPYLLQRTLGKGQTGLVRLGVHCVTRKTVAVKIINREKLSKSVLMKVEREIAIMKLIDHPHVLGLYDVYESNTFLYLVLEHVSGGELFDYLVKKGRLSEREARRFFRQIVSAVDFCHKHKVCHRDLKPENLLLDEHRNIKVADFGMASLQVGERLLETSCGSPHYACPEVIRGEHYDGRKADVWSCGVILYALLVGALPFDDDNLRVLLEKVKRGHFQIPPYIPPGAQQLLKGMVEVNPKKRLTLDSVMKHGWFRGSHEFEPVPPMQDAVQTYSIESKSQIDPDVFKSMSSLGCFKDKHALTSALLSPEPNEEKIVYFLLLSRKERQPSVEDEARAPGEGNLKDLPRKRVDSKCAPSPQLQLQRARAQSIGSANLDQMPPRSPRLSSTATPSYSPSAQGYYTYNTATPPTTAKTRRASQTPADGLTSGNSSTLDSAAVMGPPAPHPWKRKLSKTMKHLVVSPRFHRKRYDGSSLESPSAEAPVTPSPQLAKRSWFSNFRSEREKEEVVVVHRDKGFQDLKTALLQALNVVNCQYEEVNESNFRVKYESSKQKGKRVFNKKPVKLSISVVPTQTPSTMTTPSALTTPPSLATPTSLSSDSTVPATGQTEPQPPPPPLPVPTANPEAIVFDGKTFTVTFSQISGPTRRFRRVCDKLQAAAINPSSVNRMSMELVDFGDNNGHSNPSISSDDTLATSTASPVLDDAATTGTNGSHEEISKARILQGGYESTEDECESEDGLHSEHTGILLQTDLGN